MEFGWWFAGAGYDGNGNGDVTMGVREVVYASNQRCQTPSTAFWVTYKAGDINEKCDQVHFWSLHPGGGNWLFGDGSVKFMTYSVDSILPQLATRAGGEVISGDY